MTRYPSIQSCVLDECQMVKRCFAYDAEKNELAPEGACYAYLPPVQETRTFIKIEHKRKLNDE